MKTLNSVLVTVPFPENHMATLKAALAPAVVHVCKPSDRQAISDALETADAAILAGDISEQILAGKHLKWVHCDMAGLTGSARPAVFEKGLLVTGSAGRTAPTLTEHALMFMLALTYDVYGLHDQQRKHSWGGLPGYQDRRGLVEKTVGIIGLGNLGVELAKKCKAFNMRVLGYRRSEEPVAHVDIMYAKDRGETFEAILRESDFVVLATSLTDQTYHMIGEVDLCMMKPSAYLINMCRGSVVDEQALIRALNEGTIAGAGLDTTEIEPLPADSLLWDAKNVMITPHNTPTVPDRLGNSLQIILTNIERYRNGQPLVNLLMPKDVYTHP